MKKTSLSILIFFLVPVAGPVHGEDWPAFRGGSFRTGRVDDTPASATPALKWRAVNEDHVSPAYASSPAIVGSRVFVGLAEQSVFSASGRVLCLDLASGKQVWEMETRYPVFSSPSVSAGRVFVGEGFHQDSECSLYCFAADSGKKLWSFTTASHLESSPHVAGGRVFFGAGDDGIYCLDAEDGRKLWHQEGLHVDVSPLLSGGLLYAGSGYGKFEAFALGGNRGSSPGGRRSIFLSGGLLCALETGSTSGSVTGTSPRALLSRPVRCSAFRLPPENRCGERTCPTVS